MNFKIFFIFLTFGISTLAETKVKPAESNQSGISSGFTDASTFGFSSNAGGIENSIALQKAIENGGTIIISQPGIYKMASTLYIGSNTTLVFGKGVTLKKVNEQGAFAQIILNKGALTKTYDENITIEGLHLIVNDVDNCLDKDLELIPI